MRPFNTNLVWSRLTAVPRSILILLLVSGLTACANDQVPQDSKTSSKIGDVLREAGGLPSSVASEVEIVATYEIRVDDFIAACMRQQGFEYYPDVATGVERIEALGLELSAQEYAEEFGFGIARGYIASRLGRANTNSQDHYLRSLSPPELDLYWQALEGPTALEPPSSRIEKIGGCRGEAIAVVEQPKWFDSLDWLLYNSARFNDLLLADPRVQQLEASWSQCMSALGYSGFTSKDDAINKLISEFDAVIVEFEPAKSPVGKAQDLGSLLNSKSRNLLSDFTTREIRIATATQECWSTIEDELLEISSHYEVSLVEESTPYRVEPTSYILAL